MNQFINLHSHSMGSLLDGMSKAEEYAARAVELGQPAIVTTDHGNVHMLRDYWDAAKKAGIKYFPGIEAYQARKSRFDKDPEERAGPSTTEWGQRGPYHTGLIAYNNVGYHNLIKLSSRAYLEGYFVKPRLDYELLAEHSEGLVNTSGCLSGDIQQAILRGDLDYAYKMAAQRQDIFGKQNFFIEIMNHGIPEELETHKHLIEIAKKIGAPIVPTCDSHYTHKHQAHAHDALLCQPPGTQVLCVVDGIFVYRSIESLVVGDLVVSWQGPPNNRMSFVRNGKEITKTGSRPYQGELIDVTLPDGTTSSYTHDHICLALLDAPTLRDKYIVYVMRRGNRYRIGSTGYVRGGHSLLGISKRSKENAADAAWILAVFDTEKEAKMHEELCSFVYSIPTWTFKPSIERPNHLNDLWEFVNDNSDEAIRCLEHHGRDIQYPLWIKDKPLTQRFATEIRACNLIDGMTVCQFSSSNNERNKTPSSLWKPIVVTRRPYNGMVYSIDVEDLHTYVADDVLTHNCVNTRARISDENRFKFHGDDFYLKSYDEMCKIFPEEWVKNTLLVYDKYDLDLDVKEHHYPSFPTPDGMTASQYLKKLTYDGAKERFGANWESNRQITDRLDYELGVIDEMGFPNYFLVVWDIVKYCKDNGILVGFGRGSVAGCLAAYCLRITEVDSLKYDLIFERFLIPGRNSPPDIDLDIDDRYRETVVEYARTKYGYDHTAQICNYNTVAAKTAVKDAARVLGYDFALSDKINKTMPPAVFGRTKNLTQCMETAEFAKIYHEDDQAREVIETAKTMEGLLRSTGIHAAALVIADKPITEYVPVFQKGEGTPIVTQWDYRRIDELGLLKIDFLGLRNLSIVDMAVKEAKARHGVDIDPYYIPYDHQDQDVYDALSMGDNIGAFQVESDGLRELLIGMKPSEQRDLSAALALYRPGPMANNVHNEFVERKHKRKLVLFDHPALKPILESTYGLLIYQEQVLQICRIIAGFSASDADYLRKSMGKKLPEEMKKWRTQFTQGCIETTGFTKAQADKLFDEIAHHADYSFSINHSLAYSMLTYVTAYLKNKYPTEFMAAALNTVQAKEDRLRLYLNECNRMGIKVNPPSINDSDYNFKITSDVEILYGFSGIKGMGEANITKIVDSRGDEKYTSFYDFARKIEPQILNKATLEHLLRSGCFDELPLTQFHDFPQVDRSQKIDVLQLETKELGVYLTDHPMADVQDLIHDKVSHTVQQVENIPGGGTVAVAGIVSELSSKVTKTGKKMYKFRLEDMTSALYIDIFPVSAKTYEKDPVKNGDIIVLYGKAKRQFDSEDVSSVSIYYNRHEKIETSSLSGGKPITLMLESTPTFDQINKLNDILDHNEGSSLVFLIFRDGDKIVRTKFKKTTSLSIQPLLEQVLGVTSCP